MNKMITASMAVVMLGVLAMPAISSIAYAQYIQAQGQTGLDEIIEIGKSRVTIAKENPGAGSGTPLFAADGVLGALVLSTGIFGGVAAAFFVRGRSGKYAAMGRG